MIIRVKRQYVLFSGILPGCIIIVVAAAEFDLNSILPVDVVSDSQPSPASVLFNSHVVMHPAVSMGLLTTNPLKSRYLYISKEQRSVPRKLQNRLMLKAYTNYSQSVRIKKSRNFVNLNGEI